jgi:hypothetical protein
MEKQSVEREGSSRGFGGIRFVQTILESSSTPGEISTVNYLQNHEI